MRPFDFRRSEKSFSSLRLEKKTGIALGESEPLNELDYSPAPLQSGDSVRRRDSHRMARTD